MKICNYRSFQEYDANLFGVSYLGTDDKITQVLKNP